MHHLTFDELYEMQVARFARSNDEQKRYRDLYNAVLPAELRMQEVFDQPLEYTEIKLAETVAKFLLGEALEDELLETLGMTFGMLVSEFKNMDEPTQTFTVHLFKALTRAYYHEVFGARSIHELEWERVDSIEACAGEFGVSPADVFRTREYYEVLVRKAYTKDQYIDGQSFIFRCIVEQPHIFQDALAHAAQDLLVTQALDEISRSSGIERGEIPQGVQDLLAQTLRPIAELLARLIMAPEEELREQLAAFMPGDDTSAFEQATEGLMPFRKHLATVKAQWPFVKQVIEAEADRIFGASTQP